jgi:hypothetical protein
MTGMPEPPPPTELTYGQYQGWNCCWCGTSLKDGGVEAGVSRGEAGTYVLDIEVYACEPCAASRGTLSPTSLGAAP